jgi:hypothetical protein
MATVSVMLADREVWRIRNLLGGASSSQLQQASVTGTYSYTMPPNARQPGTSTELDTTDARVTLAAGASNTLWFAHGTSCQSGGGPTESCVRVVRVNVGQDSGGAPAGSVTQQTVFGGGADTYYWMPAIALNVNHRTVVTFLLSSTSQYQGSAWPAKDAASANYGTISSLGTGSCARMAASGVARSGDYVGAQAEPSGFLSFWVSAEYAAPSTNGCRWATTVATAQ